MKLSVIIPNYNHGHYLKDLLPSLMEQTRIPDEIVIVDDGSSDDSIYIIKEFARLHPCVQLYENGCNRGVIYSLNRAVKQAKGQYLTFPSADNFVLPGMYEKSLALLEKYPNAVICCSNLMYYHENTGQTVKTDVNISHIPTYFSSEEVAQLGRKKDFFIGNMSHTVVVKKEALYEVSLEDDAFLSRLKWHCDFYAWNAIAYRYGVCYIPEYLSMFRVSSQSYCGQASSWGARKQIYRSIFELLNRKSHVDIKIGFQKSTAMSEFNYSILGVLIQTPSSYNYFTFAFIIRVLNRTIITDLKTLIKRILQWVNHSKFFLFYGSIWANQ